MIGWDAADKRRSGSPQRTNRLNSSSPCLTLPCVGYPRNPAQGVGPERANGRDKPGHRVWSPSRDAGGDQIILCVRYHPSPGPFCQDWHSGRFVVAAPCVVPDSIHLQIRTRDGRTKCTRPQPAFCCPRRSSVRCRDRRGTLCSSAAAASSRRWSMPAGASSTRMRCRRICARRRWRGSTSAPTATPITTKRSAGGAGRVIR